MAFASHPLGREAAEQGHRLLLLLCSIAYLTRGHMRARTHTHAYARTVHTHREALLQGSGRVVCGELHPGSQPVTMNETEDAPIPLQYLPGGEDSPGDAALQGCLPLGTQLLFPPCQGSRPGLMQASPISSSPKPPVTLCSSLVTPGPGLEVPRWGCFLC